MPYSLKLITQPKDENSETSVFVDKFVFYNKFTNTLYFRNKNAIDLKLYQDKKNEIMHFLGLHNKSIEMDVKPLFRKWVKIELYELPYIFNFEIRKLKKGYLYYGVSSKGDYYISLENQTSMITVADAILDRVVHSSHRIEIEGDSLRPKYSNLNQKFENN